MTPSQRSKLIDATVEEICAQPDAQLFAVVDQWFRYGRQGANEVTNHRVEQLAEAWLGRNRVKEILGGSE